jgi:hypothetical protein
MAASQDKLTLSLSDFSDRKARANAHLRRLPSDDMSDDDSPVLLFLDGSSSVDGSRLTVKTNLSRRSWGRFVLEHRTRLDDRSTPLVPHPQQLPQAHELLPSLPSFRPHILSRQLRERTKEEQVELRRLSQFLRRSLVLC